MVYTIDKVKSMVKINNIIELTDTVIDAVTDIKIYEVVFNYAKSSTGLSIECNYQITAKDEEELYEIIYKAIEFVEQCYDNTVITVEPWMFWRGWGEAVGCEKCLIYGRRAKCYGKPNCHWFINGCTCKKCMSKY